MTAVNGCGCFGMANMDLSLDDIIQKKFSKTANIRGRGRYVKLCHICKKWSLFTETTNLHCVNCHMYGVYFHSSQSCIYMYHRGKCNYMKQ